MATKRGRGRPKDSEKRVKVNLLLKPETRDRMDAEIDKNDKNKSSRGRVVESKFNQNNTMSKPKTFSELVGESAKKPKAKKTVKKAVKTGKK